MTDSEIIKGLEENKDEIISIIGSGIVYFEDALSLITRQKEEIERLETLNERLGDDIDLKLKYIYELEEKLKIAKSEARREFAERLKEKAYIESNETRTGIILWHSCVTVNQINNLLEEMESESDADSV